MKLAALMWNTFPNPEAAMAAVGDECIYIRFSYQRSTMIHQFSIKAAFNHWEFKLRVSAGLWFSYKYPSAATKKIIMEEQVILCWPGESDNLAFCAFKFIHWYKAVFLQRLRRFNVDKSMACDVRTSEVKTRDFETCEGFQFDSQRIIWRSLFGAELLIGNKMCQVQLTCKLTVTLSNRSSITEVSEVSSWNRTGPA